MMSLSEKVGRIEESQTLALASKARQMRNAGIDIVSLTAGEPDFPTPEHVKEAAIRAIKENFTHYTDNRGIPELIQAIIRKFSSDNNLRFSPEQVMVSTGAKQSIFNVLQAVCNPGDEVIILAPYWVSYPEMVKLVDAVPVIVRTTLEEKFRPSPERIRRAITQKTKAVILNSPGNPTGAVYSNDDLASIVPVIKKAGIFVISDEIYEQVIYDGHEHKSIGSFEPIRDQVITVNGVSKAYAMTGWRIGYMGGPAEVIQAAAKVQSQVTSNPTSISQKAAVAALNGSRDNALSMRNQFKERRDYVVSALKEATDVGVFVPEGAFYFLLCVKSLYGAIVSDFLVNDSIGLTRYLLEQHRVALVPGSSFGDDGSVRLSYACAMLELKQGLERFIEGIQSLAESKTRIAS